MIAAILRCFGSSTFLSGVLSILLALFAPKLAGRDVPGELLAAVPLAVGWKEGQRRRADGELDKTIAELDWRDLAQRRIENARDKHALP